MNTVCANYKIRLVDLTIFQRQRPCNWVARRDFLAEVQLRQWPGSVFPNCQSFEFVV